MSCSRHNAVAPVRLEPTDTRSRVKHSTTTANLNYSNLKISYYTTRKKIQLLFFRNNVFIFNLAKCVNDKAVEKTFCHLVFVTRTDFVYSKTSKNSSSDFSKYWLIRNKFGTD